MLDSRDLTTHAVCVGMTGSGKTGLCISLLEEAALDGIPALVIDPKGDIANLLLTFPGLTAAEFQLWIDPAEAERKGTTAEALTASLDPASVALEKVRVAPRKSDIAIGRVAIAWEPWRAGAGGFPRPASTL